MKALPLPAGLSFLNMLLSSGEENTLLFQKLTRINQVILRRTLEKVI